MSDTIEMKRALRYEFESSFQPFPELFAMILTHSERSDPKQIFEDCRETFITDIRNKLRSQPVLADVTIALQYALTEIQEALITMSRCTMSQFGRQTP